MIVGAFAEVVSLGAVLPFIAILIAPDKAFRNPIVARVANVLQITTPDQLVLPLTIAFAAAALVSGAIRVIQLWASNRFTFAAGADISNDVYRRTLYQPYRVHIARGSDEVISGITQKCGHVVLGILLPLMTLIGSVLLLLALLGALIVIDPTVAGAAVVGFGGGYAGISVFTRRRLQVNSRRVANEYTQVIKALQEGLGGIRDVLLDGTQPVFCEIFRKADRDFRRAQGENNFIGQSPRFAMEALGMILIAGLAFGLSRRPGGIATALPVLGALAIGAQRLMPALQQAFAAWATMMGSHASLADTIALLDQPVSAQILEPSPPALMLHHDVRFCAVRFQYSADGPWVLDRLELNIARGSRVGIVGVTGSGKSTLLDLLMGLLLPTEGEIMVDGELLTGGRIRAWQRCIAHVPQSIYLADTTIAENIAFGVPPGEIDMERVRRAARGAQIADFIESTARGYSAKVGERGVRISGGQRQRIGIARALYKRASVLVLDEATSALDSATERSVMDAIDGLDRELTVVIIAHRLTTVQRCDTIVELRQGRIIAQGRFAQLLENSPSFRQMVHATHTA
jgi:ABC-type multidrug transport system fused ATPase/permease subunit